MIIYQVEKWRVDKPKKIIDYGYLNEDGVRIVTKGYRLVDDDGVMKTFSRRGGNYLYFAIRKEEEEVY